MAEEDVDIVSRGLAGDSTGNTAGGSADLAGAGAVVKTPVELQALLVPLLTALIFQ
jgi:hypothetical protein